MLYVIIYDLLIIYNYKSIWLLHNYLLLLADHRGLGVEHQCCEATNQDSNLQQGHKS